MNLYSCYKFYLLIDLLPETMRINPNHFEDGWLWGDRMGKQIEIYPQFDQKEYYPIAQYLLQQAIVGRGWSFGIVSPLPYPPHNYLVTIYTLSNNQRENETIGTAIDLCMALLVAYVEALKLAGIIEGSGA